MKFWAAIFLYGILSHTETTDKLSINTGIFVLPLYKIIGETVVSIALDVPYSQYLLNLDPDLFWLAR